MKHLIDESEAQVEANHTWQKNKNKIHLPISVPQTPAIQGRAQPGWATRMC